MYKQITCMFCGYEFSCGQVEVRTIGVTRLCKWEPVYDAKIEKDPEFGLITRCPACSQKNKIVVNE